MFNNKNLIYLLESESNEAFLFSEPFKTLGGSSITGASVFIGSSSSQIQRYFNSVSATDLLTKNIIVNV